MRKVNFVGILIGLAMIASVKGLEEVYATVVSSSSIDPSSSLPTTSVVDDTRVLYQMGLAEYIPSLLI